MKELSDFLENQKLVKTVILGTNLLVAVRNCQHIKVINQTLKK